MKDSSSGKHTSRRQKVSESWVEEGRHKSYLSVTVDKIPDDILLEIFDFYLVSSSREDAWQTLVHVCKRWRCIVFASPRRLHLELLCTNRRPVKKTMDIWPELPVVIKAASWNSRNLGVNNVASALKQHHRVCTIDIPGIPKSLLNRFMVMKKPFPSLKKLELSSNDESIPVLPDSFLGGSAPQLQTLSLSGIPFPGLQNLLLSTCDLVELRLWDIPLSGYFSPEAIVTGLSAMTKLQHLRLEFRCPRSRVDRENRLLPRLLRVVLPALTSFDFKGDSEYFEDIIGQIDTPLLDQVDLTFFNQLIFDTPLLRDFLGRTETFKASHRAHLGFSYNDVKVRLYRRDETHDHCILSLAILCIPIDWQLSALAQVCSSVLSPLPALGCLDIETYRGICQDDAENTQWCEMLRPFTSVKGLAPCINVFPFVVQVLEDLAGESGTDMLPTLQNIYLEDPSPSEPLRKAIGKFIAARQLSNCPVVVLHWAREGGWKIDPTVGNW